MYLYFPESRNLRNWLFAHVNKKNWHINFACQEFVIGILLLNINKSEKDNKIDHVNSPVNKLNNFGSTIVQSSFYTNSDIVELTCDDLYALHNFDIEIDLSALQNFLSQPLSLVPVEAR